MGYSISRLNSEFLANLILRVCSVDIRIRVLEAQTVSYWLCEFIIETSHLQPWINNQSDDDCQGELQWC
jgi:hypothetical protein